MKRVLAVVVSIALLGLGLMAQDRDETWSELNPMGGLFAGFELVPWGEASVLPVFAVGWEGRSEGRLRASFLTTFYFDNPVILDGWYGVNASFLVFWPRTNLVRSGVGMEIWWEYFAGSLPDYRYSINTTVEFVGEGARFYIKGHLPIPLDTSLPYAGITVALGARFVLPDLFAGAR